MNLLGCSDESDGLNRRRFLKVAGVAAVGVGLPGCASSQTRSVANLAPVGVKVSPSADPLVARTFAILKDRIEQRCAVNVVEIRDRTQMILTLDDRLPAEAFRIDQIGTAVQIAGGSSRGLLYGVGKFLRTSRYDRTFQASAWRGRSKPGGSVRGVYFASHFHNWYVQASESEMTRYLEDLALWGVNAIMVIFPMINLQDWRDPEAGPALDMVRKYARTARELGIQFATGINNTMFIGAPANIRAKRLPDPTGRRGNSGHPICPSNPQGHAYLMENARRLYAELAGVGLDILVHWRLAYLANSRYSTSRKSPCGGTGPGAALVRTRCLRVFSVFGIR